MAYIFTQGQCQKKDLYDTVLNLLIAAGWQNITSNYATDGDVLYSTGINGDKSLILNMVPYDSNGALTWPASSTEYSRSTRTAVYSRWGIRLQQSYTPGSSGTAGTFSHPSRQFLPFYLFSGLVPGGSWAAGSTSYYASNNGTMPIDTIINYVYYVDKNKLILGVKSPDNYSPNWVFMYYGLPDTCYAKNNGGRGVVYLTSWSFTGAFAANTFGQAEFPDDGVQAALTGTNLYTDTLQAVTPAVSPNQNGKHFLSEMFYNNSTYGMIGKLDGLLSVPYNGLYSGDTITLDGITYTIFNTLTPISINNGGTLYYCMTNFGQYGLALRLS